MNDTTIALLVFACFFGTALLGMRLRAGLPEHHLSADSKDAIRIGMGLVATMAALVLGLLISSTKGAYDAERDEVTEMASQIIYLDRQLANYGPETVPTRELLRQATAGAIKRIWPEQQAPVAPADSNATLTEALPQSIQQLTPQNDLQRSLKSQAVAIANSLGQLRWLLFEQQESSISMPLLVVVTSWLAIIFASTGLFAPSNATVVVALMLAALSVAGAIFLILELDTPFDGLIQISNEPMLSALKQLGR
jgi:hypothetical protein